MSKFDLPYLLLDIGGSKTRLSVSFDGASFVEPQIFETPPDFDQGTAKIITVGKTLLKEARPSLLVGGVAGPLNLEKSVTFAPPNLPGWKGKPLKEKLSQYFECPVLLENDTALVGLGEAIFGAGKDFSPLAYLTVSTGVNGVKIVNGKIDENYLGFEIGHQIIDFDHSTSIGSSKIGELEDFISGREIEKRFGKKPEEINDPKIWEEITYYLSIFVYNTILYWSPKATVLGGSIIGRISLDLLRENLSKMLKIFPLLPEIKKCQLGETGGLYGGLAYAKNLPL